MISYNKSISKLLSSRIVKKRIEYIDDNNYEAVSIDIAVGLSTKNYPSTQ